MDETFLNPQQPPLGPEAALDLTRAILSRTSGSPCQRLQTLACEYVDGELGEGQASLVRAHLEHCAACSALVTALSEMDRVLPTLAQVDPGPWFTQRIMRVTVHVPRRDFGFDPRAIWSRLLHRPRIALETAYLGAAAGMMGLYLPHPTLPSTGAVPTIVQALSPNRLVQPLVAPAQRVAGSILQAEQRTATALKGALWPKEVAELQVPPGQSRWQVVSLKVRSWLKGTTDTLRSVEPVPKPPRAALGAPGGAPQERRDEHSGSMQFEPDAEGDCPPPQPEGTTPGGRSAASASLNDEPHRPAGPSLRSIPPDVVAAHGGLGTGSFAKSENKSSKPANP